VTVAYVLRCRECGKTYGVQPLSYCDECFSSLEVAFDLDYARSRFTRESVAAGPLNMWRYRALLPVADDYTPETPVGLTPLVEAPRLGAHIGARNLYLKNDAVCMPTLSFKDRVVAVF
jgi:threonine synthase